MELIKVDNGQIVTAKNKPIRLRGWNIGGWLNMEDFINGFVGAEHNKDSPSRSVTERAPLSASRAFTLAQASKSALPASTVPREAVVMPQFTWLKDEDVAAVLTYIRSQFGNSSPAVTPDVVARVRAAHAAK